MADAPDTIVLVHLRRLDARVSRIDERIDDMSMRRGELTQAVIGAQRSLVGHTEHGARRRP